MSKIVSTPVKNSLNPEKKPQVKPNENSGVNISTHLKISDPNTGQIIVQKRGDT